MLDPRDSDLFDAWEDPTTGVRSYLLQNRVAPVQQSFYFVNPSGTPDGRYLWFYAAFPPAGDATYGRALGVADLAEGTARWFPETLFSDTSPLIDPATGAVYWATGTRVFRRGPTADDPVELVNSLHPLIAKGRRPWRLATHFTRSADGTSLTFDCQLGAEWYLGDVPLDGSEIRIWQETRKCYNHAQFSPTDPALQLVAQDHWVDPVVGGKHRYANRMWLLRLTDPEEWTSTLDPVFPTEEYPSLPVHRHGHEWWDPDGEHAWFVDYTAGTSRVHLPSREIELVWPGGRWHSHSSHDGRFLVGDGTVRVHGGVTREYTVTFYDARAGTGTEVALVSRMPAPSTSLENYHLHPHPRFVRNDQWVVYTTLVTGQPRVALCPVAEILEVLS